MSIKYLYTLLVIVIFSLNHPQNKQKHGARKPHPLVTGLFWHQGVLPLKAETIYLHGALAASFLPIFRRGKQIHGQLSRCSSSKQIEVMNSQPEMEITLKVNLKKEI